MKTFLFIFMAGYAVRCDDSNYYVIQRPDDPPTFKVYWNVPTMQCKSKKIPFSNLYEKFGILQNDDDSFRGEKVSILYDPGLFPALLKNESSGQFKYRNGGVPQEGDLIKHLEVFKSEMEQSIPDEHFNGVGIIDFESWRPVFRQNFGVLTPYKDVSYEIEKKNHWWWKKAWIQAEAKRRFEESARAFMQTTLATAKKMRPHAQWGYYGFPYCFNMASNNMKESCADKVPAENDGTYWLWSESTTLYPSVYSSEELSSSQLASLIKGRVAEAKRVGTSDTPILPYFWFRYRNGGYFREKDLHVALSTLHKSNASGVIIWGSSNDVNTVDKCNQLLTYVNEVLGPAVAKYTKHGTLNDEYEEIATTNNPINTSYDPEFDWIPPKNYTENIQQMVDEELADKNKTGVDLESGSMLIDLILHSIANYCADDNCRRKDNKTTENIDKDNSTETSVNSTESTEGVSESRIVLVTDDPFRLNKTDEVVTESTTTDTNIDNITDDYMGELLFEEELENSTEIIVIEDYVAEYTTESTNPEVTTEYYSTNETNSTEDNLNSTDGVMNSNEIATNSTDAMNSTEDDLNSTDREIMSSNDYATNNTDALNSSGVSHSNNKDVVISNEEIINTDMVYSNYTKILNSNIDTLINLNDTYELNSNDTDVLNSNDTYELNSNDTDILNSNDTEILNSNDTDVLNSTTLAPILTNQVIGSASITRPRLVVCLFYIYSLTKCLCVIFQMCLV